MLNSIKFIETPGDLTRWATSAKRNQRVAYYRGWLMKDKLCMMPYIASNDMAMPQFRVADKAWELYTMGAVELFQKRLGADDYLYIAVRK
jgi:hypothetical protein